jgi:tetratricopeptide (TPR) repeat protein
METGLVVDGLSTLTKIFNQNQITPEEKASLFYPILFEQLYYANHSATLDTIINIGVSKHSESIQMNELCFEHYIRRNSFNSARSCLQNLTKLDQENPTRLEKLISFDYSLNQKELVIYNSIKASNEFPQYYIFYIFQALAFEEMDDVEKAINALNSGIEKVTDNIDLSELYGTLGDIYYKKEIFKEAFKSYDSGLKHNPNNARILNNYSYYLAITGTKLEKAYNMSSKAVELEPNNSTYIDTKGWVLFIMERYDESRDVLRNAIAKSGSNSAVINEHYGDALYKTGNKDNAYIYWLKAKEIEGGSSKLDEKIRTKTYIP